MKIVWKVQPRTTGQWRSFQQRGWPEAWYNDCLIAIIMADEPYHPKLRHPLLCPELTIRVFDYRLGPQGRVMKTLKRRAVNLEQAKNLVKHFFHKHGEHHDWLPGETS